MVDISRFRDFPSLNTSNAARILAAQIDLTERFDLWLDHGNMKKGAFWRTDQLGHQL